MNKNLKRILALIFSVCLLCASCAKQPREEKTDDTLTVYASVYPLYAVARAVCSDVPGIDLHCMIQPQDGCFRDYSVSDWDAALIASADAVIIGGRGLESFENALNSLGEQGPAIATVLYNMELDETGPADVDSDASHWTGPNPQVYMSIDGVEQIAESISAQMTVLDPANAEAYRVNLKTALKKCDALKSEITELAEKTKGTSVIVMNEACVYAAKDMELDIAMCIDRDGGEAFYDSELDKCIEKMKSADTDICMIEKQAPARFVAALREAGFKVLLIDVLTTGTESETFDDMLNRLRGNARSIAEGIV